MGRWKGYAIFLAGIILQKLLYLLSNTDMEGNTNYLLDGIAVCADIKTTCSKLIFWYFPSSILFFICSGRAVELVEGYAAMQVTRGEKRWKLVVGKQMHLALEVTCLLLFQTILLQSGTVMIKKMLIPFLMLLLTVVFFVLVDFLLELFADTMVSCCIVQVFFVSAIFMSDMVSNSTLGKYLHYILFSCFAFAKRNGISQGDMEKVAIEAGLLLGGIAMMVVLSVNRYKKRDLIP